MQQEVPCLISMGVKEQREWVENDMKEKNKASSQENKEPIIRFASKKLDVLNVVALVTALGVVIGSVYTAVYLSLIGRFDLFIPVVQESTSLSMLLTFGMLIGFLAVVTLAGPSYFLIIADEMLLAKDVIDEKINFLLKIAAFPFLNFFIFLFFILVINKNNYPMSGATLFASFSMVAMLLYFLTFKKEIENASSSETYFKRNLSLFLSLFFSFASIWILLSIMSYYILKAQGQINSLVVALSVFFLILFNGLASLLPAIFYFVHIKQNKKEKVFSFLIGLFIFILLFSFSNLNVLKVMILNIPEIIGVSEKKAWEYYLPDENTRSLFDNLVWNKNCKSTEKHCVVAKPVYKVGSIVLICPVEVKIEYKSLEVLQKKTEKCVLLNSSELVKVRLFDAGKDG